MRYLTIVALLVLVLTGCVSQPDLIKPTLSGNAEGIFKDKSVEEVRSMIVAYCSEKGFMVEESTSNRVVCSKPLEGMQAVVGSMAVGGKYATNPDGKVAFVLYRYGDGTKAIATHWYEAQSAYGQTRRQAMTSNSVRNSLQKVLFALGAE